MLTTTQNPGWWNSETESDWDRVKEAMKRDWVQTQHDLGADQPDLNQKIGNTLRQAGGKEAVPPAGEPNYDDSELAYRFGYGAHVHFGDDYPDWDEDLEEFLQEEWEQLPSHQRRTWMEDRAAIRYGWEYQP
jgi:hypothetical protein